MEFFNRYVTAVKYKAACLFGLYSFTSLTSCPACESSDFTNEKETSQYTITVNLVRCSSCGLVFQNSRLDDKSLNKLYNGMYRPDKTKEHNINMFNRGRRRGKSYLNFLYQHKFDVVGLNFVDIGCGFGGCVSVFKDAKANAMGTDLDSSAVGFGVREKGLNLKYCNIDKLQTSYFDLVLLSHVLEHVAYPNDFLRKVSNLLTKDGKVLIEVPKYTRDNKRICQLGHLLYFESRTFENLLKRNMYELVKIEESEKSIRGLFGKLNGK